MKKILLLPLVLSLSINLLEAGNMVGPAPFRNGSPLVSGNDGTYQATARAENVTGIFRFAYSGGSQTADERQNSWIFFVNGRVVRGLVVANLNESKIDGVLDRQGAATFQTSNSSSGGNATSTSVSLPSYEIYENSDSASGTFSGKLNLKSPNGAFNGDGNLIGTLATQKQLIGFAEEEARDPITGGRFKTGNITLTDESFTITASSIQPQNFKFRGVRTSTSTTSSSLNGTPSN